MTFIALGLTVFDPERRLVISPGGIAHSLSDVLLGDFEELTISEIAGQLSEPPAITKKLTVTG
ncbi:hypothetical protein [Hyphomicrobium sp. MC1]|uniref:hypothetical protein n=1 Tax=Hyphomicrobium sp. (strain MC1) TaxID=717785 RepID=UPI000213D861|nr:hypothetical protein [Hyphomicrobium sp. MC1]CCB65712.1 protein of unknown function [Hyphomicrobium sp. MC1]